MAVIERSIRIVNELGVHARPAAEFVKVAGRFAADIIVSKDSISVNGKSIMGVMTLAAECGSEITVRAEGNDAEVAVTALEDLINRGFDE